jgi:hypothetical protein
MSPKTEIFNTDGIFHYVKQEKGEVFFAKPMGTSDDDKNFLIGEVGGDSLHILSNQTKKTSTLFCGEKLAKEFEKKGIAEFTKSQPEK